MQITRVLFNKTNNPRTILNHCCNRYRFYLSLAPVGLYASFNLTLLFSCFENVITEPNNMYFETA